jgi:hypothetical protein
MDHASAVAYALQPNTNQESRIGIQWQNQTKRAVQIDMVYVEPWTEGVILLRRVNNIGSIHVFHEDGSGRAGYPSYGR